MATNYFLGRTTHWPDVANWSLGIRPIDDHHVIVPDTTQTSLLTGLDRTGDSGGAGLDLSSFFVHEGYSGNIGSLGNPLKCRVSGLIGAIGRAFITMRGSGSFYFDASSGASGNIIVNSRNVDDAFILGGDQVATALSVVSGHAIISAGYTGTIANAFVTHGGQLSPASLLDLSANAITTLHITTGTAEYSGLINNIHIHGGVVTAKQTSNVAYVYISSGLYVYNASPNLLGVLHLKGGTVDATRTATEKTITALYRSAAGTLLSTDRLTITYDYKIFGVDTD